MEPCKRARTSSLPKVSGNLYFGHCPRNLSEQFGRRLPECTSDEIARLPSCMEATTSLLSTSTRPHSSRTVKPLRRQKTIWEMLTYLARTHRAKYRTRDRFCLASIVQIDTRTLADAVKSLPNTGGIAEHRSVVAYREAD